MIVPFAVAMLAALCVIAIVITLAALWRRRRYRASFRIPARRDDSFPCRAPQSMQSVTLHAGGFDLPTGLGAQHTALLEFRPRAMFAGRWRDPYIDLECSGRRCRQYFERGVAGQRYLNLSPILPPQPAPSRVSLRGVGMQWEPAAKLIVFDAPAIAGARGLIVAPHPDDAEIAAFGVYADSAACIVTVTAGERTPTCLAAVVPERSLHTHWHALLRNWDSLTIPQLGNIPPDRCVNLVYPDTQLTPMRARPEQEFTLACEATLSRRTLRARNAAHEFRVAGPGCRWPALVADLRRVMDLHRPDFIVCPHPLIDAHPDHIATTVALAEALRGGAHAPAQVLLYAVHALEVPLFPFGESTGSVSLPPGTFPGWIADSIYSHALSPAQRQAKYFAIEAAHDIRSYPASGVGTFRQRFAAALRELSALVSGTPLQPGNYLRRGARPNEIFYVTSPTGLQELAAASTRQGADPRV